MGRHHGLSAGAVAAQTLPRRQSMRPAVCALCAQTHIEPTPTRAADASKAAQKEWPTQPYRPGAILANF